MMIRKEKEKEKEKERLNCILGLIKTEHAFVYQDLEIQIVVSLSLA